MTSTERPSLSLDGLSVFYGDAEALHEVSLTIHDGEIVSVVGANGAGKTTMIRAIAGMVPAASGSVRYGERDITRLGTHRICELGIAQVPEGRQIFPTMTVQENLTLGAVPRRARKQRQATLEQVYGMFPRLAERRRQDAGTLSGGEQQMLAVGRCLMSNPRLIMFDEPSLGLSPLLTLEVFDIVKRLNAEGMTILLVEQNVEESLKLSNRAYVLENGELVLEGTGSDLLADTRVRQAYLGI